MNCQGCGVDLDPSIEQVNDAVDEILETSLSDAQNRGGVCPLCGHNQEVPYSHRKTVLFSLLLTAVVIASSAAVWTYRHHQTQRNAAAEDVLRRMESNPDVSKLLGKPLSIGKGLQGHIKEDETGWKELRLIVPVQGLNGQALVRAVGGSGGGPWLYTTFEVVFEKQHKKFDLISGRVLEYDPAAYQEVHFEAALQPDLIGGGIATPRWDGNFPCVFASVTSGLAPQLGNCSMPTMSGGPVDRTEADLRYGAFILRQTDLYLNDVFQVPLTRTYTSNDWISLNNQHAFGWKTNHPFDIAPLGARNPYRYQLIALEDSNFIYFDRISKGTGYADAVFQHTETSTRFYKATTKWNGNGWTTRLNDGTEMHFPESYDAKNLAQGAAIEITDPKGNRLELKRNGVRDLEQILTPHGHWIKFQYDQQSRIVRADDDAGNWAKYNYNPDGMLAEAILSSGHERHYSYDKTNMTLITDEKGTTLLHNSYDHGLLAKQDFANGSSATYRYDWPRNAHFAHSATVTVNGQEQSVNVIPAIPEYVRNAP